jgi:hypothetical protein
MVLCNNLTTTGTSNHRMNLSHQATHQKAHGERNADDSKWSLTNPIAGLRYESILYRLPSLTACNKLIGRFMYNRRKTINRAVCAVLPGLRGAIGMLGRALVGHE